MQLCGNTKLHTGTLWKHILANNTFVETQKNVFPKQSRLWKHKVALGNFVFPQSWFLLTCVGIWSSPSNRAMFLDYVYTKASLSLCCFCTFAPWGCKHIYICVCPSFTPNFSKTLPALLFDVFWRDIVKPL